MASYSSYLTKFYKPEKVAQMEMDNTSDSQLGAQVTKQLRPSLKQNIQARKNQTMQNRSALDSDAAARGMGSSTWLTDIKNRAKTNEAGDISTINANYNQNLYSNLQNLIQNRNSRNQTADNFNKSALNSALQAAMAMASQWAMYDKQLAAQHSHGGGGGSTQTYYNLKTKTFANKKNKEKYDVAATDLSKYQGQRGVVQLPGVSYKTSK